MSDYLVSHYLVSDYLVSHDLVSHDLVSHDLVVGRRIQYDHILNFLLSYQLRSLIVSVQAPHFVSIHDAQTTMQFSELSKIRTAQSFGVKWIFKKELTPAWFELGNIDFAARCSTTTPQNLHDNVEKIEGNEFPSP